MKPDEFMIPWTDQTNIYILNNQSSIKYQFSPTLAGYLDILNLIRHNGGFGIAKTPNFALNVMAIRDQRHANVSKQTSLLGGLDVGTPKWCLSCLALFDWVQHLKCIGSFKDSQWTCKYIYLNQPVKNEDLIRVILMIYMY